MRRGDLSGGGCAYLNKCFIHVQHGEMITFLHGKFSVRSSLERKKRHSEADSGEPLILGGNATQRTAHGLWSQEGLECSTLALPLPERPQPGHLILLGLHVLMRETGI